MAYKDRSLVRDQTVKFYVSDREKAVIDTLVERHGGQRQVVIRDIVMAAIDRALQANDTRVEA
jgi:hypothetical protein